MKNKYHIILSAIVLVFFLIGLSACLRGTLNYVFKTDDDTIRYTHIENECTYGSCNGTKASGSRYCIRHTCSEDGCYSQSNANTMFEYCDKHEDELTCIEPECYAPKYRYAKSDYCKTHYINHIS